MSEDTPLREPIRKPRSIEKPEGYDDLDLVGYLYNSCYGGFSYSKAFKEEFKKRVEASDNFELKENQLDLYGRDSYRTNPIAVQLFQEMGSEASSGSYASISITWIPREFLEYTDIREYDGQEGVGVQFDEMDSKLLKKFLDEWKTNPSLTVEDLNQRYTTMKAKVVRYREYQKERWNKKLED